MARKMTKRMAQFYVLAQKAKLPNPLGRAAQMTSRCYNNGHYGHSDAELIHVMKSFRTDAAQRWSEHWLSGGSLKKLGMSQSERSAERKAYEKLRRERLNAWKQGLH